jgi:hypothetical protein
MDDERQRLVEATALDLARGLAESLATSGDRRVREVGATIRLPL